MLELIKLMIQKKLCLLIIAALAVSILPLTTNTKAQSGSTATLSILPSTVSLTQPGETFTLGINISGVSNLFLWDLNVTWDPTVLSLVGVPQEGSFLAQGGSTVFAAVPPSANVTYWTEMTDALFSSNGVSGSGELASIEFKMTGQSPTTSIHVANVTLEQPLPAGANPTSAHPTISLSSSSSLTTTINFSQGAPAANAGAPQTVIEGTTVTFDGSKSISTGTNPAYTWTFTDNGAKQTLTGINPTYTYKTPGIYTVTLTVTDSYGQGNSTETITVQSSSRPVAKIAVESVSNGQSVPSGQSITLDGTGSYEANNGTIARYLWTMDTASGTATTGKPITTSTGSQSIGTNATITYPFTLASGLESVTYNITLAVFDATGLNGTATTQITVVKGSVKTSSPSPTTTSTTWTSSSNSTSSANPTPTPSQIYTTQVAGVPTDILAIMIILTLVVIVGSTIWLRKRT
jgi:PKD repeat protein